MLMSLTHLVLRILTGELIMGGDPALPMDGPSSAQETNNSSHIADESPSDDSTAILGLYSQVQNAISNNTSGSNLGNYRELHASSVAETVNKTNKHSMTTREKAGIFKPKAYVIDIISKIAKQALTDERWATAMRA